MKVAPPTNYQSVLLARALCAARFGEQRKALWRAVYKQANATVRHHALTWTGEQVVDYWLTIIPDEQESNSIELDDLQTGFRTISQESGATVVPLDSLEEHGDTWVEAPESHTLDRLSSAIEWRDGVHPVTDQRHLPRWCDNNVGADPEAHLEPEFLGFQGDIGNTDAPPWGVWERIVKARKQRSASFAASCGIIRLARA